MDVTGDDMAGVVDLFDALTRAELQHALAELAFKRGEEFDPDAFEDAITHAVETYHLVPVDADAVAEPFEQAVTVDEGADRSSESALSVLVPGPVAFPTVPDGGMDLPHILDIDPRTVDREQAGESAITRFEADATAATNQDDSERLTELVDISYELEAWASVDLSETRAAIEQTNP